MDLVCRLADRLRTGRRLVHHSNREGQDNAELALSGTPRHRNVRRSRDGRQGMIHRTFLVTAIALATGCDWMPGKPTAPQTERGNSEAIHGFVNLWGTNCQGCHGAEGTWGAARPLNDPLYQSLVTDEWLRTTVSDGINGTLMPPHSISNGGRLTDEQIQEIVSGMRSNWTGSP
ncbi:MAG TPA: hypothetical protein DEO92_02115, partial [Phycisphaerales bacterium]|nr:hypothetical protein [Phycisphaerales bacterium]